MYKYYLFSTVKSRIVIIVRLKMKTSVSLYVSGWKERGPNLRVRICFIYGYKKYVSFARDYIYTTYFRNLRGEFGMQLKHMHL